MSKEGPTKITIALADDHDLVRKSVAALLREETDFEIVGECADGHAMLEIVGRFRPAMAVVDIAMPELSGIEVLRSVKEISPETRVIVLSNYTAEAYVREALEAGASGYILKKGAARDLIQAIRAGARGGTYLSQEVAATVQGRRSETTLSKREREVLKLIAEGKSSKEIAAALGISSGTVKCHRRNIMEKLDIHDKAVLSRYAEHVGLVHPE
jgi:DNA-binding NarL/FixJ family response regulator